MDQYLVVQDQRFARWANVENGRVGAQHKGFVSAVLFIFGYLIHRLVSPCDDPVK